MKNPKLIKVAKMINLIKEKEQGPQFGIERYEAEMLAARFAYSEAQNALDDDDDNIEVILVQLEKAGAQFNLEQAFIAALAIKHYKMF